MNDNSGDRVGQRYRVAAGLSLVFMASLVASCSGGKEPAADETTAADVPGTPAAQPMPVVTAAPLGRAELLAALAAATDETAAGNPLPAANLELTDRTFELRLPIGCSGDISADGGDWSIDPKTRVLRISVRPQAWGDDPTTNALAAGITYDAAEGFWMERPWTRSEKCPPPVPAASQPAGDQQPAAEAEVEVAPIRTFALVQYFSPDGPRTLRRGARPYSYTGKVPETEEVDGRAFHLKLTGRIRGFPGGQPIRCVVLETSRPPTCAAAVEFTEVVLEDAATGKRLAGWTS